MTKRWMGFCLALLLVCSLFTQGMAREVRYYQQGDQIDDFPVTLADGTEVRLYDLLAEKKAVLLNFWTSWCGPCREEFPAIQAAYDEVSDEIGIIALSVERSDTDEAILAFKESLGLTTLPMGRDNGIASWFGVAAIPLNIMIDRNGIACFMMYGSVPDKDAFLRLFALYTADDYDEPILIDDFPAPEAEDDASPRYTAVVTDEAGAPVPGVMIQICDEGTCTVAVTDAQGVVTHEAAPYPYEFHVLKAPDAYAPDTATYVAPAEGGTVQIVLKAA